MDSATTKQRIPNKKENMNFTKDNKNILLITVNFTKLSMWPKNQKRKISPTYKRMLTFTSWTK